MKPVVKQTAAIAVAIAAILLFAAFAIAWSGTFNVAADAPHSRPVYAAINFVREQSVRARASDVKVPDLTNRASLVKGAGNYDAMCAQCHRSPEMGETELSRGLYPAPPNLSNTRVEPSRAFWSIKHGIKASGMPAWGKSMNDADIWNLVSLLQKLPDLNKESYEALVQSSSGHSHAGAPSKEMHDAAEGPMQGHAKIDDVKPSPEGKPRAHEHQAGEEH